MLNILFFLIYLSCCGSAFDAVVVKRELSLMDFLPLVLQDCYQSNALSQPTGNQAPSPPTSLVGSSSAHKDKGHVG